MDETIRIATRASRLAVWQADHVRSLIHAIRPSVTVELVQVVSSGDVIRDRPLSEFGGVGVFTKEIQDAVLDGRADLAVHSLKDLPTASHQSLQLVAVPERGPTSDAFVSKLHSRFDLLPQGARVATSSPRRRAQMLRYRPDLHVVGIRGNVESRLRKLEDEGLDGILLAVAGLSRLGLDSAITEVLDEELFLPAVGQGALGIECRAGDTRTTELVAGLDHAETRARVEAERALLATIQGGCQVPLGARTELRGSDLRLSAVVVRPDGRSWIEETEVGNVRTAVSIGRRLGQRLLASGATELLLDGN